MVDNDELHTNSATVELPEEEVAPSPETFWKRYSPNYEMTTSVMLSIFWHILIPAIIIYLLSLPTRLPDRHGPPIQMVDGGMDDFGDGSAGSGGNPDPLAKGDTAPTQMDMQQLPNLKDIPDVVKDMKSAMGLDDPNSVMDIPEEKAAAYAALDKSIRDKLLGVGQQRGAGKGSGSGDSGQSGVGPGGTGSSSTRARSVRWIIRFNTSDGRNYLSQLASLKAVVITPLPPTNKQAYIFRDLSNPKPGTMCSEADWDEMKDKMQFSDFKKDSVDGIRRALGMDETPNEFWAFFPREIEEQMAELEKNYRNRKPEDIEKTIFRVVLRNGQYVLTVEDQKSNKQR